MAHLAVDPKDSELHATPRVVEEMMNVKSTTCLRCKQPLSQETGYCSACGLNHGDAQSRQFKLESEADARIDLARRFRGIFRADMYFFAAALARFRSRFFR